MHVYCLLSLSLFLYLPLFLLLFSFFFYTFSFPFLFFSLICGYVLLGICFGDLFVCGSGNFSGRLSAGLQGLSGKREKEKRKKKKGKKKKKKKRTFDMEKISWPPKFIFPTRFFVVPLAMQCPYITRASCVQQFVSNVLISNLVIFSF